MDQLGEKAINTLAYYRTKAGLTQKELAEKVDVKTAYIGNLECGNRDISGVSGTILLKLSKALGCTIEELLC